MRSRPGVVANVVLLLACLAVHAANGAIVLVDFGRHDGTNGHETIGADINGNIWNNFSPPVSGSSSAPVPNGAAITNLVTTSNIVTSIGVTMMGDFWASNGRLNGGLFSPNGPQTNLLGRLAVETATEDFFFIWLSQTTQQMIRISGLATNRTCNLRFFATREAAETRITRYVSGTNSVSVTTSGTDIGSNGIYDGNDDEVVGLYGLQSDTNGAIDLLVQLVQGQFAYLGILEIQIEPEAAVLAVAQTPGVPAITVSGSTGEFYQVEWTSALEGAPWQAWTNLFLATTPTTLQDTGTTNVSSRFYRAVTQP